MQTAGPQDIFSSRTSNVHIRPGTAGKPRPMLFFLWRFPALQAGKIVQGSLPASRPDPHCIPSVDATAERSGGIVPTGQGATAAVRPEGDGKALFEIIYPMSFYKKSASKFLRFYAQGRNCRLNFVIVARRS